MHTCVELTHIKTTGTAILAPRTSKSATEEIDVCLQSVRAQQLEQEAQRFYFAR